ncbi:hypothetical protein N9I39_01840 [Flavobacteriaceae bacterium]|nr:hypothetical protein [Flavobacteriaceae bacterium]
MKKIINLICFSITITFIASCANRGTPSGGELDVRAGWDLVQEFILK